MTSRNGIKQQAQQAVEGLLAVSGLKSGQILVLGCSSSEIGSKKIGTGSNMQCAEAVWEAMYTCLAPKQIYLAVQCCEHLNRALVVEEACAEQYHLNIVSVIPHVHAGGAMATTAYHRMQHPVVVEYIQAHAGIDIGETMIGMHLRPVAVPVRLEPRFIGGARVNAARTRPKYIGGERAVYQ